MDKKEAAEVLLSFRKETYGLLPHRVSQALDVFLNEEREKVRSAKWKVANHFWSGCKKHLLPSKNSSIFAKVFSSCVY